ncbi:hypothetical protein GCM10010441_08390 [Kitasatospora paracochleata]|uniref:Uncharacterized protein n=1 Tax=Kitasatospora paracochleata TaxID=58354 RepID=A0ABT1IX65_9ACTN|nr:hypothetical protein [Kitasatospora paracochleata]MCP2309740.1 hypothetical protein [Kitasatospora paracochleata]
MSYELNALIAAAELIHVVAAEVPAAQVVPLGQGLALIPMTDRLHDALQQPSSSPGPGFTRFPGGFGLRLAAWSKASPLAYVEAATPDGDGTQRAAVWWDGTVVLGPLRHVPGEPLPTEGAPIDRALHLLGARPEGGRPESDAIGLTAWAGGARG